MGITVSFATTTSDPRLGQYRTSMDYLVERITKLEEKVARLEAINEQDGLGVAEMSNDGALRGALDAVMKDNDDLQNLVKE
jgi:hypothetical protein